MKKISVVLLSLILLAGCQEANSSISSNKKLFKIANHEFDEKQLFDVMKRTDQGQVIIQDAQKKLIEGVDLNDDMLKEAEEMIENTKQIVGDDFDQLLEDVGVKTEEEYLEEFVYPELKLKQVLKEQIIEDFDEYVDKFQPVKARILQVDEDQADQAVEEIKANGFSDVTKDFILEDSQYQGQEQVYFVKTSQLPGGVSNFLTETKENKISDLIKNDLSQELFIVEITEHDAANLQDEVIQQILGQQELGQELIGKAFKKKGFKVYDKVIYESLKNNFPEFINEE